MVLVVHTQAAGTEHVEMRGKIWNYKWEKITSCNFQEQSDIC